MRPLKPCTDLSHLVHNEGHVNALCHRLPCLDKLCLICTQMRGKQTFVNKTDLVSRLMDSSELPDSLVPLLLDPAEALSGDLLHALLLLGHHAAAGALCQLCQALPPTLLLKGDLPLQPLRSQQRSAISTGCL